MAQPTLKQIKQKRDGNGGAVMIIPHCVLNSAAYLSLSGRAIKLLYDIAMQYNTNNNGALLASWRYMREKRGWTSAEQLGKAKQELLACLLIVETVKGRRPNKASWYGLTWLALDPITDLEVSTQAWPRGAYARWQPLEQIAKRLPPARKEKLTPLDRTTVK